MDKQKKWEKVQEKEREVEKWKIELG
jgi:hypothetical protein